MSDDAAVRTEIETTGDHLCERRRQRDRERKLVRRMFTSQTMDLYVWIDVDNRPVEFQLCYDTRGEERALTFARGRYSHARVHSPEHDATLNVTPVLVSGDTFDRNGLHADFIRQSELLATDIREFVGNHIRDAVL